MSGQMIVGLSLSNLAAVKAAAEDEERSTLYGLTVCPKGTIATDGYVLVRVEALTPDDSEMRYVLLYKDDAEAALDAVKKTVGKHGVVKVSKDGDGDEQVVFEAAPRVVNCRVYERVTPDYDSVMPRDKPQITLMISFGRLLKLLKVLNEMKPEFDAEQPVLIAYYGEKKPIRLTTANRHSQRVDILVMPMIGERKEWLEVPVWKQNGQVKLIAEEEPQDQAPDQQEVQEHAAESHGPSVAAVEG